MNPILVLVLLAISILGLTFLGWSFIIWTDGYKDASLRMSFGEFRRIYDLAPSKCGIGVIIMSILVRNGFRLMRIGEESAEDIFLRALL